jgi:hypothetical protein
MSVGQGALAVAADVAALDALEAELAVGELDRGAQHVASLRRVLRLHAVHSAAGMSFSTVPHAALAMGCSEHRAGRLLAEALALAELPGGLEAVECGLLTVEQSGTVVTLLAPLPWEVRLAVWRRLQARLGVQGVLPPARLGELLRRWIGQTDPEGAQERRRSAEDGRRIEYRRRDDGLGELFALGFRGPDLQAVLSRIAARSAPVSIWDDRTADQRRFDVLKDLLLGRESLPLDAEPIACPAGGGVAGCGCRPGAPVPCGAEVLVHLRWETGLGTSDEPAELVGHGPLEPDLLSELLLAAPRLRAVWTDEHGTPVAVDDRVVVPPRGDPQALRQVLLDLPGRTPPARQPRTPDDHPPPSSAADGQSARAAGGGPQDAHAPGGSTSGHPPDDADPYRPPRRVRRLTTVRAPRCEWPGCGARAVVCDAEHDRAWPDGPTCACNLGPCCRRHHRVKQCGWVKTRHRGGSLTWTSPTGRAWLSPAQHQPPAGPTRPLRPVPTPSPWDELNPGELDDQLRALDLLPHDDLRNTAVNLDRDVPDSDRLGHRIGNDTRWTLDLENPYLWIDRP